MSCGRSLAILVAGRTKELSPELKERFVRFAKSLGLKDDNIIFSVPTGKWPVGEIGKGCGDVGTVQAGTDQPGEGKTSSPALAIGIHFELWESV